MRVGVVHDWLDTWRGGEVVLAEILRVYPDATLFALVDHLDDADRQRLNGRRVHTSFIDRLPFSRSRFRMYLPLFPAAIASLDLAGFDLVLSSSHAFAKGVRVLPSQLHVCYCYTPMRYAWDLQDQYLRQTGLDGGLRGLAARALLGRLRDWDRRTSKRVDHFIAISHFIARRIRTTYGRDASVIYPPVSVAASSRPEVRRHVRDDTYVTVSALVPYKRIDVLAEAFRLLPDRTLVVIGDGPDRARLLRTAPANVRFLGRISDDARDLEVATARGFVYAAEEDFGIAPLEAQGLGTPVIAFAHGALAETIRGLDHAQPTGVLFGEQSAGAAAAAIRAFESAPQRIASEACRANAARFASGRFRDELRECIAGWYHDFVARDAGEPRR
ncbi:MAG: glycosyltransferase [Casimicrobiaceae bacterium]